MLSEIGCISAIVTDKPMSLFSIFYCFIAVENNSCIATYVTGGVTSVVIFVRGFSCLTTGVAGGVAGVVVCMRSCSMIIAILTVVVASICKRMSINSISAAILAILSVIFAVNKIHIAVFVSYVVSRITANVAGGITAVAVNVI